MIPHFLCFSLWIICTGLLVEDRLLKKLYVFSILVIMGGSVLAFAQVNDSLKVRIGNAYLAIEDASSEGGDVSHLVESLNFILEDVNDGDFDSTEVMSFLDSIILNAELIEQEGVQTYNVKLTIITLNSIIVMGLCFVTWRFFPSYYWRLWLKSRGNWRIKE